METNEYNVIIPVSPNSINEIVSFGSQFSDIRSLKKKWEDLSAVYFQELIDEQRLPEYFTGVIGVRFFIYFEKHRRRDEDNYYLMCKGIIDCMVNLGLVEDDNSLIVKFDGIRCYVDRDRPRIVISIIEYLNVSSSTPNRGDQKERGIECYRTGQQAKLEGKTCNTFNEAESVSEEESHDNSRIGID